MKDRRMQPTLLAVHVRPASFFEGRLDHQCIAPLLVAAAAAAAALVSVLVLGARASQLKLQQHVLLALQQGSRTVEQSRRSAGYAHWKAEIT